MPLLSPGATLLAVPITQLRGLTLTLSDDFTGDFGHARYLRQREAA